MSDLDDTMRRIAPSDLLALRSVPSDRMASLASSSNPDRGAASPGGSVSDCSPSCTQCQGAGQLLMDEADAAAVGRIILERREFLDRWRVEVACSCAAGQAVIASWQQLPPDAVGVTLESLWDMPDQDQAIAAVERFCANPVGWLTFGGEYGVGKTALLYATLNRLAAQRRYGRYITAPELIDKLRNLIRHGGDPDKYLDRWCDAPLIAVDELDKVDLTPFAEKSLFRLFNARYQRLALCGTLLAYNLDRESNLLPFLRSRIADGRFQLIILAGDDVRPALGEDAAWDRGESEAI